MPPAPADTPPAPPTTSPAADNVAPGATPGDALDAASTDANHVTLRGRVSGEPTLTVLPSGDELVALRLVVRRPDGTVDTLPVRVGPAPPAGRRPRSGQIGRRLLATAAGLPHGGRVEVAGWLRRRWWSAGGARQSRIEVQAEHLTALPAAADPAAD